MDYRKIYFEYNRDLLSRTVATAEDLVKFQGLDFANCSDEFLKEMSDIAADSFRRALFECFKIRRNEYRK